MCGIGVVASVHGDRVPHLMTALDGMSELLVHRGPDGCGTWGHDRRHVGFAHLRLAIIGLIDGEQPMTDGAGNWITYNGEIYNYEQLRTQLGASSFRTGTDTEVILRLYRKEGVRCLDRLRGMFAFALWDEQAQELVVVRDRFGIKPLYYTIADDILYCASEAKALLPFVPEVRTDLDAFRDYVAFQFPLHGRTLFSGIHELPAAHVLRLRDGAVSTSRWWDVVYEPDLDHSEAYFVSKIRETVIDAVDDHLVADVPVGAYLSGGLDSSIISTIAADHADGEMLAFTGRFEGAAYDESSYARQVASHAGIALRETTIGPHQFAEEIGPILYHLDYPVAGPGSFPQFIVSRMAAAERKVVLGGQGGDEIFGGYARYLLAYFEQCIKAAIEGTSNRAPFIVTYESIIPNLETLREYRPLIQSFWRDGVFDDLDRRYFRLVNRAHDLAGVFQPELLEQEFAEAAFHKVFGAPNVGRDSYFDRMTHFDFKTLLPALLQVEDRVSMAHGLESRTPFVDHHVVELAATLPALVKFKNGELKRSLKLALGDVIPPSVAERKDKMGFPVPLAEWANGPLRAYFLDLLESSRGRDYLADGFSPERALAGESGRGLWGLVSLEVWHGQFHDRADHWRNLRRRLLAADDYAEEAVGA